MRALVEAVANSIESEVSDSSEWEIEQFDRMWRNPKKGKVLNVYAEARVPSQPEFTGGTFDTVEITLEYGEPTQGQPKLERDAEASYSADDVADQLRDWAANHTEGFTPAWKMDWAGTQYTPRVRPEMFVRYARVTLVFSVRVAYG